MSNFKLSELKNIANDIGISINNKTKSVLYKDIMQYFNKEEQILSKNCISCSKNHPPKYIKISKLGVGKEGVVYKVKDSNNKTYAMKTFKKVDKNVFENELSCQKLASKSKIAPKVFYVDNEQQYIVMEKMERHLTDYLTENKGKMNKQMQLQILRIFKTLDKLGLFQKDPNLLNYMLKDNKVLMIDFGMCCKINNRLIDELGTDKPNIKYTMQTFIMMLQKANCPLESYNFLK